MTRPAQPEPYPGDAPAAPRQLAAVPPLPAVEPPAQPQPYPGDLLAALPGTVPYRRTYADVLGRPMTGSVTITGQARTDTGGTVVVPAPVAVALVDGVLDVALPPDTYRVEAALRTVDGARIADNDTVTLTA